MDETIPVSKRRTMFFVCEPLIAGFCIFPLLIMFWQSGWNFMVQWLESPLGQHLALLLSLYFVSQLLLLFIYINQDRLYDYLTRQKSKFFAFILLQLHSFLTAANYIIQWVTMWTLWDRYTSDNCLVMVLISIIAILSIIVLTGHPCDLVCAPFIVSYDSIEYNVRIGTPFITEKVIDDYYLFRIRFVCFVLLQMNQTLAHILNYLFYEHVISLLTILAWRGSYGLLDVYLYPDNEHLSAGISLLIGYPLFFLLMYTQSFQNEICFIPKFLYSNYPSFFQNLRHLSAFFSCVLLWRGFWILFDLHIATISLAEATPYVFYIICMMTSFVVLSIMRTGSSINGPMSQMVDEYDFFPLYPNYFLVQWLNRKKTSNEVALRSNEMIIYEPFTITMF